VIRIRGGTLTLARSSFISPLLCPDSGSAEIPRRNWTHACKTGRSVHSICRDRLVYSFPNPLLIAIPVLSHQAKALSPSEQEPGPCLGVRSGFSSTSLFPCAAKLSDTTSMLLDWVLPSEAPTPHRAIDQSIRYILPSTLQRSFPWNITSQYYPSFLAPHSMP
jgi:hypothetical protein